MKFMKKRIAVFLSLMLTIPAILGALPQAKLEAQAASTYYYMNWTGLTSTYVDSKSVVFAQMTKNTTDFYLGDYIVANKSSGSKYTSYGYLSMNSGATYKSSDSSVASINSSTGLVKAKKKGKTTLTVTWKGQKSTCELEVVSSVGSVSSKYNSLKKSANSLIKTSGKKITGKNRYKAVNAWNLYKTLRMEIDNTITTLTSSDVETYSGLKRDVEYKTSESGSYYGQTINKVKLPILQRATVYGRTIDSYISTKNPIGTGSAKLLQSKSISGKNKTVTVTLKSKVTADQIFGIQAGVSSIWDTKIASKNTAQFPVYIKDTKTGHKYYALATVKKGSNKLTIKTKTLKLKKNVKYKLIGSSMGDLYPSWSNKGKVTFKAK